MDVLKDLNKEQKRAVTHGAGPLLIVAGAGTGKTTVITRRLAWLLLEKKLKTNDVLALTFTEKAAGEMEERVDKLLPLGYEDLWIHTFHEFGKRVLEENALDIGLDPNFKVLTEADQYLFIRKHLFEFELDYFRPLGNPTKFIQALVKHFSRAKDEEIDPDEYIGFAEKFSKDFFKKEEGSKKAADEERKKIFEIANAYKKYQELMLKESYLDFGDLILYALKLFRKRKSVLEKFQRQFKYILVDEFQDTNFAQYQLLKLLSVSDNNLTVVGDDDQSVFRFRGAALNNILNFKKDFPKAQEVVLTKNYRSPKEILSAAYDLIQGNNPDRLEVQLDVNKKLKNIKTGDVPKLIWEDTVEREAITVAKTIVNLRKKEDREWRDFAILVRANAHAEPFIKVFERNGIPYQFVASTGLYRTPEILDLISYLRVLNNFMDDASLYRVTRIPTFEFDPQDVIKLLRYSRKKSVTLYEAMDEASEIGGMKNGTLKSIEKLFELLKKHAQDARDKRVSEVLVTFLGDSGYLDFLKKRDTVEENQRFENIVEFFKRIQEFQRTGETHTVKDFVEELELSTEGGDDPAPAELEEGPDTVKVMTLHKAKGLEFPVVFLVSLVEGMFPTREMQDSLKLPDGLLEEELPEGSHIQEERRLFYVGMTRAIDKLYLAGADDYGGKRKRKPSRFLKEIDLEIAVSKISAGEKKIVEDEISVGDIKSQKNEKKVPRKFSYTQMEAFWNCPLQYKFRHIMNVPTEGSHTFSYGRSLHQTLRDFYTVAMSGKVPSEKDLLKMLEENWINEWYDGKSHEQKRFKTAQEALKNFYKKNKRDFGKTVFVEKEFNIKMGKYVIRGVMDRVDKLADGTYEIIDYKTGQAKKGEREIKRPIQLMLYAKALKGVLKLNPSKLTLYYIDENKPFSILKKDFEKKMAKVEEKALKTFDEILESDFSATPNNFICRFCDYKVICPHRK